MHFSCRPPRKKGVSGKCVLWVGVAGLSITYFIFKYWDLMKRKVLLTSRTMDLKMWYSNA